MADQNEFEAPKKSKTMLIVIIVIAVNLAIGGVVIVVMMGGKSGGDVGGQANVPTTVAKAQGDGPGPIIQLENFVVNIQSDEGSKYLKAAIAVELSDPSVQDLFRKWDQVARNEVLIYLSSLEVAETITAKQKRLIEDRLKGILNKRIGANIIVNVYFTEFVTQ